MEYFIGILLILLVAGFIVYYRKDILRFIKKITYVKECVEKKTEENNVSEHDKEYDMDILAKKIAKAWWKEYNKRLWIKIIFAVLLFIIGINAVDSYMESIINQLKSLFDVFSK